MKLLYMLMDYLFPSRCVSCGIHVSTVKSHICDSCFNAMKQVSGGCSRCCGVIHNNECSICGNREFYPSMHIPLYEYTGPVRQMIYALKFQGVKHIYKRFIPVICSKLKECRMDIDIITCVPMSRGKEVRRGYNQSKLVAETVAKRCGLIYKTLLRERKNSISQRDLNYTGRFINVIDRYVSISDDIIRDKTILLIDDVFTTGATINECARQLLIAGAYRVYSLTLVRADLKKIENI